MLSEGPGPGQRAVVTASAAETFILSLSSELLCLIVLGFEPLRINIGLRVLNLDNELQ